MNGNITISDFRALWAWCDGAGYAKKDNAEFWRRFVAAISVYNQETRLRLMEFVLIMNR